MDNLWTGGGSLWTTVSRLCNRGVMDALDEALVRSREARLAEALRVHKATRARRRQSEVVRKRRRMYGLRARHAAKLARLRAAL